MSTVVIGGGDEARASAEARLAHFTQCIKALAAGEAEPIEQVG